MFIKFKKLRYKNFLSTGNIFTEIQIDQCDTTLCYGSNASGKTSMVDAMFFALYGKSFRKVKKNDIVNYITKKNAIVELEFVINKSQYKIIRGIKPNIFEVYKNDVLISQDSTAVEYQKYLENYIIQMPENLFTQTVLLGATNYTPFMLLSSPDRRTVVESLLDIKIFSIMNEIGKEKNKILQRRYNNTEYEIEKDEISVKHLQAHIDSLSSNKNEMLENIDIKIVTEKSEISVKQKEILLYDEVMKIDLDSRDSLGNKGSIRSMIQSVENYKSQFQTKYKSNITKIDFYSSNDICPSCSQDISSSLKDIKIEEYNTSNEKYQTGIEKADLTIQEQNDILQEYDNFQSDIDTNISEISRLNRDIENHNTGIETLNKDKSDIENSYDTDDQDKEIKDVSKRIKSNEKTLSETADDLSNYETVLYLLKDDGIKSRIVKTYIPVINQLIKKYLDILEFPIIFKFDEDFNDYIKVRGRDEVTFPNLSEGERSRVNLALMFAFRELAKLRNATHTNFLVFDEIADSSLDIAGWESFLKIMQEVSAEGNQNVFVISHKGFIMDRFTRSVKFEKKSGRFSEIVSQ